MDHREKLGRAYHHLEALATEFGAFAQSEPYIGTSKYDVDTDEWVLTIGVARDVDQAWGLIIGDVAHNLRSSLDNLAFALVRKHSGEPAKPGRIQFPIFDDPDPAKAKADFDAKRERYIGGMHPDAITLIESVQPYQRRDRKYRAQLAALNDLSNVDKHRHLHLTGVIGKIDNIRLVARIDGKPLPLHGMVQVRSEKVPVEDGAVMARIKVPHPGIPVAQLEMHPDFAIDVAFAREWPMWGASVHGALKEIHDYIRDSVFVPLEAFL